MDTYTDIPSISELRRSAASHSKEVLRAYGIAFETLTDAQIIAKEIENRHALTTVSNDERENT